MLKSDAALRKDRTTRATLEHRHFAEIARIIAVASFHHIDKANQRAMADMFAHELAGTNPRFDRARFLRAGTNPRFDRARFLRACNVES